MTSYTLHVCINNEWVSCDRRAINHQINIGDYLEFSKYEQSVFGVNHGNVIGKVIDKYGEPHLYLRPIKTTHPKNIIITNI